MQLGTCCSAHYHFPTPKQFPQQTDFQTLKNNGHTFTAICSSSIPLCPLLLHLDFPQDVILYVHIVLHKAFLLHPQLQLYLLATFL
jgi:hypothetical protein